MVELEIDGRKVEVGEGSMVMHAASKLDIFVPHFCYHKKLSIAANCRMCLVEVEKAPKPMPACATPVTNGMKVFTHSERAVRAQKGVMEFLLINHPLDCPICDQGGECQLQDLAVGYGGSSSHYQEAKRVVLHKSLGPLVSAEEMSRCIQCTRCVRFGQEIAGVMELGMTSRGEHSEITSFLGRSVDSELSGNMIDICPVGALTSKPFRYSARTWELSRRRSVSGHDALGSNLVVQVKGDKVMRVVPYENESINECWLSDRDRFAYEGLNSDERLRVPMLKQDGRWHEVDWQTALDYAAHALGSVVREHGAHRIGALAAPSSTLEELHLLQALVRGLGSDNVDARLRQTDFSADRAGDGVPWLGTSIESFGALDRFLFVGSFLRKDHPLLAARVRQAGRRGARVAIVHACDDDLLMPVAASAFAAPSQWAAVLAGVLVAVCVLRERPVPSQLSAVVPSRQASEIAACLASGERVGVFLGSAGAAHPDAANLAAILDAIAGVLGGVAGVLGDAANSVGLYLAGATPAARGALAAKPVGSAGLDAAAMLSEPLSAYLLLHLEPSLDTAMPARAMRALGQAASVIALSAYRSADLLDTADCLLPIAPFTETGGTFVSCEGRVQSFNGVVAPLGEARPAWKVLRVLGNLLGLAGFAYDSVEAVRAAALPAGATPRFGGCVGDLRAPAQATVAPSRLERIAEVPIYAGDPIVRRAASLQRTRDAAPARARACAGTIEQGGLRSGERVRVTQGDDAITIELIEDATVAPGVLRLPAAVPGTAGLAAMFGPVTLQRV